MSESINFIEHKLGVFSYNITKEKDGFFYGELHRKNKSRKFNIKATDLIVLEQRLKKYLVLIKANENAANKKTRLNHKSRIFSYF